MDPTRLTEQLQEGIVTRQPEPVPSGEVEGDEVYVVAGHKGHPEVVKKGPERPAAVPERDAGARDPGRVKSRRSSG